MHNIIEKVGETMKEKYFLCDIEITEEHYFKLSRSIYDILITLPIREQDKSTIRALRKKLFPITERRINKRIQRSKIIKT